MAAYLGINGFTRTDGDGSYALKVVGTRRGFSVKPMENIRCVTALLPYVLQYQLKRNLRPFTREEILQLPTGRSGVYVLWRKTGTEGQK